MRSIRGTLGCGLIHARYGIRDGFGKCARLVEGTEIGGAPPLLLAT